MRRNTPANTSKTSGGGWKIPARENHHWWPKGLSALWAADDGTVGRLSHAGDLLRSPPKNFGSIANAHFIKMKGPWNATIEPIFDFVDTNFPGLARRLVSRIESQSRRRERATSASVRIGRNKKSARKVRDSILGRVIPRRLSDDDRYLLAEGLASLIIRSPAFRHDIQRSTNAIREQNGQTPIGPKDGIIAGNIHQWYSFLTEDLYKSKMALLYSSDIEYILGEGYYNNLRGAYSTISVRALVPVLPTLAVFCFSDVVCETHPRVIEIHMLPEEVAYINFMTQISTKDYVFFRSQKPEITDEFRMDQFLRAKSAPFLSEIVGQYCRTWSGSPAH